MTFVTFHFSFPQKRILKHDDGVHKKYSERNSACNIDSQSYYFYMTSFSSKTGINTLIQFEIGTNDLGRRRRAVEIEPDDLLESKEEVSI